METLTWTVVFRDSPSHPQQELVRYTPEAANKFASDIIMAGGVAVVIEDSVPDGPDLDINNSQRSKLQW